MKRSQHYLTSATLIVAAAFAGGVLTSDVLGPEEANGVERPERNAPAAAEAPAATTSSVDPCTLITQDEAAAALGTEVTTLPTPGQCTYVATDTSARGLAVAMPDFSATRSQLKAGAEQTASALDGTSRSIDSGDEAYAVLSPMVSQALGVESGTFLVVALTNPNGTPDQQATTLDGLLGTAFGRI